MFILTYRLSFLLFMMNFSNSIILEEKVKVYIDSLVERFEKDPSNILFQNPILPPYQSPNIPVVLIWSPLHIIRFSDQILCPDHQVGLSSSYWTNENKNSSSRNPRLIFCREFNIVLIQQYYSCQHNHSILSSSNYIVQHQSVKDKCNFPYEKYHKSIFSHKLIEHVFLSLVQGVSFNQIAEGLESLRYSNFLQRFRQSFSAVDEESEFYKNIVMSTPTSYTIEMTFLDIYNKYKTYYKINMAIPTMSISTDHTFKVGKSIGGFRKFDNKYSHQNLKLFIILTEQGLVAEWVLTKTTSQIEIEPLLESIKSKLSSELKFIYTDNCCSCKSIYEKVFPNTLVKLDLFHACQRVTKSVPNRRSPEAIRFCNDFGLIFRKGADIGLIRNVETPSPSVIFKNLDQFLESQSTFLDSLVMTKKNNILHEIDNLKKHIELGCLSGIPPGGGTENNERIHRYLNRSFLRGASVVSMELAEAVLAVLFFIHNARSCKKKQKTKNYFLVPFNEVKSSNARPEKIEESISPKETLKISQENPVIAQVLHEIFDLYNTLTIVKSQNIKKGFKIEALLNMAFGRFKLQTERIGNVDHSQQIAQDLPYSLVQALKSFSLKVDPVEKDGDCLFRSILLQLSKYIISSECSLELKSYLNEHNLKDTTNETVLQLRKMCVTQLKTSDHYSDFIASSDVRDIDLFLNKGFFESGAGDLMVQLCADVIRSPIIIVTSIVGMNAHLTFPKTSLLSAYPIYISFDARPPGHYDGTLPIDVVANQGDLVRCQCRSVMPCKKENNGYQSRCPCIHANQPCNFNCKCKSCQNNKMLLQSDSEKRSGCRCGSKIRNENYQACVTSPDQLRATKCPCFKQQIPCDSICLCRGCKNTYGARPSEEKEATPKKRMSRESTKYKKARNEEYLLKEHQEVMDGVWTLLETSALYYLFKCQNNQEENFDVKGFAELYNLIADASENMIKRKSERQLSSKLAHLNRF